MEKKILVILMFITLLLAGSNQQLSMNTFSVDAEPDALSLYTKTFEEYNINEQMTVTPLFSPDFSLEYMTNWLYRANTTIEIENQYIKQFSTNDWTTDTNSIMKALVDAHDRGVTVRVIVNEDADTDEAAAYLQSEGISVKYMSNPDITHNKFVAIDDKIVMVSSINYSEQSLTSNRESGVVIHSTNVADYFLTVFEEDWSTSITPTSLNFANVLENDDIRSKSNEMLSIKTSPTNLVPENFTKSVNMTLFVGPDTAHETIFKYLDTVTQSLWVEMYTLSKQAFTDKLIDLKADGVDVRVLLSHRRVGGYENIDTWNAANQLVQAGIPVFNTSSDFQLTHSKFWIIDGESTFIYSGNWSPRSVPDPETDNEWSEGEVNREMGIGIHDSIISDYFENVFLTDWSLGEPWSNDTITLSIIGVNDGDIVSQDDNISVSAPGFSDLAYKIDTGSWINITSSGQDLYQIPVSAFWNNGYHEIHVKGVKDGIEFSDTKKLNFIPESEDWKILISEVLFDPAGEETEEEFVELVNAYNFDIYMENWELLEGSNDFIFPVDSIFTKSSTIVLARSKDGFNSAFGKTATYEWSMSLSNTGDAIELFDAQGTQRDAVAWGKGSIDGVSNPISVSNSDEGYSIQREPIYYDSDDMSYDFVIADPTPLNTVNLAETTTEVDGFESWVFLIPILAVVVVKKRKKEIL